MVNALPRTHLRLVSALLTAAFMAGCGSARTDAEFAALYVADDVAAAPTTTTGPGPGGDGLGQATGVPEATGESTGGSAQPGSSVNTGADAAPATVETEGAADPAVAPVPDDDGSTDSDTAGAEPATEGQDGDGGTSSAPPSNGEPIRVATIGTLGGPIGSAIAGGVRGAQAWAAAVNAAGGVDGHPIELFAADDGGDPARYRSLLAEMVENRGVVAVVHTAAALSGQAGVPYVEERGIPVIGSEGGSPWFNTSPMHFPSSRATTSPDGPSRT